MLAESRETHVLGGSTLKTVSGSETVKTRWRVGAGSPGSLYEYTFDLAAC